MSRYHKATHRLSESTPSIVDWNGKYHNSLGSNLDEVESRDPKVNVKYIKDTPTPKKIVHVNVDKATPETQKIVKSKSTKNKNGTYTYTNKKK